MTEFRTAHLHAKMTGWRRAFHSRPELGFDEHKTSARVAELLREFGLDEVHEGIGGTGVVGILRRGDGKAGIGLRADMDALPINEQTNAQYRSQNPGIMHACGHDGHTTMLLGAAAHLKEHGKFNGTVTFIFQPSEENGRGAPAMMADGLFERFPVDAVYGIHNMPRIPVGEAAMRTGPIMAREDNFVIDIQAEGGHAAMPHLSRDGILIGSAIVQALQSIVSRSLNPADNGVVSVTEFLTDGSRNAIPGAITLKGDTRSFKPEVQQLIESRMREICEGICLAHGARCEVSYSHEFVPTVNSPAETATVLEVANDLLGADRVDGDCLPIMGSEDFGHMLNEKPGCYFLIGNGTEGANGMSLHNPHYDFNDDILPIGADMWTGIVEKCLPVAQKET